MLQKLKLIFGLVPERELIQRELFMAQFEADEAAAHKKYWDSRVETLTELLRTMDAPK